MVATQMTIATTASLRSQLDSTTQVPTTSTFVSVLASANRRSEDIRVHSAASSIARRLSCNNIDSRASIIATRSVIIGGVDMVGVRITLNRFCLDPDQGRRAVPADAAAIG